MASVWVILGHVKSEVIEQDITPTMAWSGGKRAPLFPLYIQCRSRQDARAVQDIHKPLLSLYKRFPDEVELARAIHNSLDCSLVMSDIDEWHAVLNGRTYRGILISGTDLDLQSRNFIYFSWRVGASFKDALMLMVLKGEKSQLNAIKAATPPVSPASTSYEHLSISALSLQDDSDSFSMSPPVSACGRKVAEHLGISTSQSGPSQQNIKTTGERQAKSQTVSTLMTFRQQPLFPRHMANRVYKYIRSAAGTVGTIHDHSGAVSHLRRDEYRVLGSARASYLDSHGYGAAEVEQLLLAFTAPTLEDFVEQAEGCGMSVVELEWFWALE